MGLLKQAIYRYAPGMPILDLMHDVPQFDVRAASRLLVALVEQLEPGSVVVAVVDPGVGGDRLPVVLQTAGYSFVGPHNGLMDLVMHSDPGSQLFEIDTTEFDCTKTFHGRDIFAPVAAMIATRQDWPRKKRLPLAPAVSGQLLQWPAVIYIDDFGNAMTGLKADHVDMGARLKVNGEQLYFARTFSTVQKGALFWYRNSLGLVELAANSASAAQLLNLQIGNAITIHR